MKLQEAYGKTIESVTKHPVAWGIGVAALTAAAIGIHEGFEAFREALAPNGPVVNIDHSVVTGS